MSDADYEEILRLIDEQSIDKFLDSLENVKTEEQEAEDDYFKFEHAFESITQELTEFKKYTSD